MINIDIINTTNRHNLDKVSCYERPVSDILNYYAPMAGDLYIIMRKILGLYGDGQDNSISIKDILSFNCNSTRRISKGYILNQLSKGNPVIVAVNLKEIFFTKYFKTKDWPHWLLIKGYDEYTDNFCIIDNIHNSILGKEYEEFHIPRKIVMKAAASYKKRYEEDIIFTYENQGFCYEKALEKILDMYIYFNKGQENLIQYKLLRNIAELTGNSQMNNICSEMKQRLINVNKYKEVISEELDRQFALYGIETGQLKEVISKNTKLWQEYSLRVLMDISKGDLEDVNIPKEILFSEAEIDEVMEKLLFEERMNRVRIATIYAYTAGISDGREIIEAKDSSVLFTFNDGRLHNWWLEDNAPKYKVYSGSITRMKVKCDVTFGEYTREEQFQVGIYIKSMDNDVPDIKPILCAYDNCGRYVIDTVGESSMGIDVGVKTSLTMELEVDNNILRYRIDDEEYLAMDLQKVLEYEVGLACKTWGNGGYLQVKFENVEVCNGYNY